MGRPRKFNYTELLLDIKYDPVAYNKLLTAEGDCLTTPDPYLALSTLRIIDNMTKAVRLWGIAARIKMGQNYTPGKAFATTCGKPNCLNPDHMILGVEPLSKAIKTQQSKRTPKPKIPRTVKPRPIGLPSFSQANLVDLYDIKYNPEAYSKNFVREGDCLVTNNINYPHRVFAKSVNGNWTSMSLRLIAIRLHYQLVGAKPPPKSVRLTTKHTCGNKYCLAPEHLLVTLSGTVKPTEPVVSYQQQFNNFQDWWKLQSGNSKFKLKPWNQIRASYRTIQLRPLQ